MNLNPYYSKIRWVDRYIKIYRLEISRTDDKENFDLNTAKF